MKGGLCPFIDELLVKQRRWMLKELWLKINMARLSQIFEMSREAKILPGDTFALVVSMLCFSVEVARGPILNSKGKSPTRGPY